MAKKLVYNYVFTPGSAGAGTISFVGSYQVKTLLLITNVTTNEIIYSFADPTKGGTTSYSDDTNTTTITLTTDTSSMTSSDDLQIFVACSLFTYFFYNSVVTDSSSYIFFKRFILSCWMFL